MTQENSPIVVCPADCASHSVHTTHIHHRNFPEIYAECGTLIETAEHLAQQLLRAQEGARSAWHRESIEAAIADVHVYREALARGEDLTLPHCDQCDEHAAHVSTAHGHPHKFD